MSEPRIVSSECGIFIHQQELQQCNIPWKQPRSNCNQLNFICVKVSDNGRCKTWDTPIERDLWSHPFLNSLHDLTLSQTIKGFQALANLVLDSPK
ncbi:hypothetical protein J6590_051068 [Homalodisca vitripennis]|nr:hypothetical protein J6590_051068 [Homalodisca vitripennis]